MGACLVSEGGRRTVEGLSWVMDVVRACLVAGGWMEVGTLLVEVARVWRVVGWRWREEVDSVDVREELRGGSLWLSEVNGGLLTDGLWLSDVNGGLLTDGLWLSEVNGGLLTGLWLSDVNGGLLTGLWASEDSDALVPVGRGGGRMEPSPDGGRMLLDVVRWDKLAARVSRDVVVEEPELGGLVGSLLGE